MGHGGDVVRELTADHEEMREHFRDLSEVGDPASRRVLADRLTIALVRHCAAEEEHFYPAVRAHLDGGDLVADKELADHARAEALLKRLGELDAGGPEFARCLDELRTDVLAHLRDEEENLFPTLRHNCPQPLLDDLGDRVRRAKRFGPTRPHPDGPATPPANRIADPALGLVDRARDLVSGRGRRGRP
ncbi:hemerythrin domain-containing protein [Streptomyces sp. NPDC097619]|uniref:hemerythrin domain-containing protein n=1 Tax=Streptomyces sp. NPDC097619 TaxID=3157228 RepID=UPI0033338685